MTSKSSLRETLSIAHTAECKLHLAATRPDRDLRFLLGHALTLDSITLRLLEIDRETSTIAQPRHASSVKFQAAGNGSTVRRRSPPPSRLAEIDASDEEEDEEDDLSSDDDQDELALMRFPSGSERAPEEVPGLVEEDGSSDEEEGPRSPEGLDEEFLRGVTSGEGDGELMDMYAKVKKCPCHGHHVDAPELGRIWELPPKTGEERADGVRIAVAEVAG